MTEQPQELVWLNNSAAISVRLSEFPAGSGQYGIDIRKYISGERYSGFTKKGIWIPVESRNNDQVFFEVLKCAIKVFADHKGYSYTELCKKLGGFVAMAPLELDKGDIDGFDEGESAKD